MNETISGNVPSNDTIWIYEDENKTVTTANGGKASFNKLIFGYHTIIETNLPVGYVITGYAEFYIKIDASGTKLVKPVKNTTTETWSWQDGTENANVTFEAAEAAIATATVGNTPGLSLPSTGGPGTRLFTILGSILIAGEGLLLWRRRRLI